MADFHSVLFGGFQVNVDVALRIHHDRFTM
jgi:hypothetical protein